MAVVAAAPVVVVVSQQQEPPSSPGDDDPREEWRPTSGKLECHQDCSDMMAYGPSVLCCGRDNDTTNTNKDNPRPMITKTLDRRPTSPITTKVAVNRSFQNLVPESAAKKKKTSLLVGTQYMDRWQCPTCRWSPWITRLREFSHNRKHLISPLVHGVDTTTTTAVVGRGESKEDSVDAFTSCQEHFASECFNRWYNLGNRQQPLFGEHNNPACYGMTSRANGWANQNHKNNYKNENDTPSNHCMTKNSLNGFGDNDNRNGRGQVQNHVTSLVWTA
ncbi:hypothetical protein ACA910_011902 [Epithemia clementina (nom. ined.)]